MSSLQEIGIEILRIQNNLKSTVSALERMHSLCRQFDEILRYEVDGSSYQEYEQTLYLLQSTEFQLNCSIREINNARAMLEKWMRERIGAPSEVSGFPSCTFESHSFHRSTDEPQVEVLWSLSKEEIDCRWRSIVDTTNEVINNYREALTYRGIPNGRMLEKFLMSHKSKMLNYERSILDTACGLTNPNINESYKYRIAGATGEYGYDGLADEYGSFCLEDASKWLKDINPNFNSHFMLPRNNPYRVNCGSCAFAVDSRLSGNEYIVASSKNIGSDYEMEIATGKRCVYMTVSDIEAQLRNHGPGSHLIVGINRASLPNGCPQSGHWFNALYDGKEFHTLDGQSGEILDWPYDYGDIIEWCALV